MKTSVFLDNFWRYNNIGTPALTPNRQDRARIRFFWLSLLGLEGLAIAEKTLYNFVERAIRLYEQGPGEPCGSTRLGEYAKRWVRWAYAGLPSNAAASQTQKLLAFAHPAPSDVAVVE